MWMLFFIILLGLVLGLIALKIIAVSHSKIDNTESGSVLDLIMDWPKISTAIVLGCVLVCLFAVKGHLYGMYDCTVRGYSQNVKTDYSWYYSKCRFYNQHGVLVDFDKIRGTPTGEEE